MRITQDMTARMLLSDLSDVATRLQKTQERISSGKQITAPSDDPFATSRALQLRDEVDRYSQFQRNISEATGWQTATDTALASVSDLTLRARDLVVEAANGSLSASDRAAIAEELRQIVGAIQGAGNAQYGGRYVLAGTATQTKPFDDPTNSGRIGFVGNDDAIYRDIGVGEQVRVNADGRAVGDVLDALQDTLAHLDSNAPLDGDLAALDGAHDAVTNVRAQVGALGNRLDIASDRLAALKEAATKLLSQTEDADMAQTLIDYSTQQAVYQAALKAGANLIQPSLLDFLR